ncbi:MAG: sorbosone dehydrogenase family protein [Planctomycetota bacterium]
MRKLRLVVAGVLGGLLVAFVATPILEWAGIVPDLLPSPTIPSAIADDGPRGKLERLWGDDVVFARATHVTSARDGTGRLFVCEQRGVVHVVSKAGKASVFLDISERTRTANNEEGLLAVAFHPRFKENGFVFACYSTGKKHYHSNFKGERKDPVVSRVSRFTAKGDEADPKSEKVILDYHQPWGNHNGGQVEFGPDGFLYIGPGDGGAANDPEGNGQRLDRLLGKILRIDVDSGDPYGIPKDNPFVKVDEAKPEVFAYGMRNPWRFSFDRKTGALWAGDVGQNKWEMIRKVEKGTNQGWRIYEGSHVFDRNADKPRDPVVMPVFDYGRGDGASVTGGFVYRGKKLAALEGIYVFADYVSGHIFALREQGEGKKPDVWRLIANSNLAISSFGEDEDGELLVVQHANENGRIFKLGLK